MKRMRFVAAFVALLLVLVAVPVWASGNSATLKEGEDHYFEVSKDKMITVKGELVGDGECMFLVKGFRKLSEEWTSYGKVPPDWTKQFPSGVDQVYIWTVKGSVKITIEQ
ncbi:MAG: hypothetical protein KQJ78_15555 [Deltaproteobacteria bacterium]|nr:hypothetical protein [Deltaproteobacteria bacterium]